MKRWLVFFLFLVLLSACLPPRPTPLKPSPLPQASATPTAQPRPLTGATPQPTAAGQPTSAAPFPQPGEALRPPACTQPLCAYTNISLLRLMNRPLKYNILKLVSAAADPLRNRVYVAGILTPNIAILDGATETWIGVIETGMDIQYSLKYLHLDPVANYLYIIDESNSELRRIDLNNGQTAGPIKVSTGLGQAAVDTRHARLYLAGRDAPYFSGYDGKTLRQVFATNEIGRGTGRPVYDEKGDALYVTDIAAVEALRPIYRLNPDNGKIIATIRARVPQGQRLARLEFDPLHKRFILATLQSLLILDENGNEIKAIPLPRELIFENMYYDAAHDRVGIFFLERPARDEAAAVGGVLQVFDPGSGKKTNEIAFGKKPNRPTLNPTNGKVYFPNGDASVVWSIPADTYREAKAIRLGDSVEQVVLANQGGMLFMNSRLGGSYIVAYNVETGAFNSFSSGTWPIPIRTDANGERLFVLNAWDSTLSVYGFEPERRLLATIPIGLPRGTTDRLPDLAIDSIRRLAFAAYPEFGKVAVVNWEKQQAVTTLTIPGVPLGEEGGGPGNLQVTVDEGSGRLFALVKSRPEKLLAFTLGDVIKQAAEIDLSKLDWRKLGEGANSELLFMDAPAGRLFVGPFELDLATLQPTGRMLGAGQRVFAIDPTSNVYWVGGEEKQGSGSVTIVAALNRGTLAVRHKESIGPAHTTKPDFAFDPVRRLLYVGSVDRAEVKVFAAGKLP